MVLRSSCVTFRRKVASASPLAAPSKEENGGRRGEGRAISFYNRLRGINLQPCHILELFTIAQLSEINRCFPHLGMSYKAWPTSVLLTKALFELRSSPANKQTLILAVVNGSTSAEEALDLGADFALSKPILQTRLRSILDIAVPKMERERRRYF